jgi:hypothetical protein
MAEGEIFLTLPDTGPEPERVFVTVREGSSGVQSDGGTGIVVDPTHRGSTGVVDEGQDGSV